MATIHFNGAKECQSETGQSVLDALAKVGGIIGYSCKTGRCSSCKCKVISGESQALSDELGLTADEKAAGWILSCVRTAISDLHIEVDELLDVALPLAKTLPCRIESLERIAADVMNVVLRLPLTADFLFLPGQYIEVINPQDGFRRSYSLANSSATNRQLELHIRRVELGVMSHYWFSKAKVGDLLRFHGPQGTFVLRDTTDLDLVFLATGTGIAPIKAMLESLVDRAVGERPRSIKVYWGGRRLEDLYWEPASIAVEFVYKPVLSQVCEGWKGATGYIQNVFLAECSDLSKVAVYACGSDVMIHSAKDLLVRNGLPARSFYSDAFVCSAAN